MLTRQVLTRMKRETVILRKLSSDPKPPRSLDQKVRAWRQVIDDDGSFMKFFQFTTPASKKRVLPANYKWTFKEFVHYVRTQSMMVERHGQRFIKERHELLGCDLATAHFVVFRGGRVKFDGQDEWITKETYESLPKTYEPQWHLTHIDASNVTVYWEGLDNFQGLYTATWASFHNNPVLNEWHLDRISANLRSLEYLDVSQCENLKERGLEALCRMSRLKTLVITDFDKSPTFELKCMMLEDVKPGLKIEVREPFVVTEEELQKKEAERKKRIFWFGS